MIISTFVSPNLSGRVVKQCKHLSNFSTASSLQNIKSNFDVILRSQQSENYSFDVVKFAYLTMPRITQCCWPYSIIDALIISPRSTFQPHSLLSSGSRHRLSVGSGSGKSMKQSISSPAISDIIKSKVGDTSHGLWYYYVNMSRALRAANLLITSDSFRRQ